MKHRFLLQGLQFWSFIAVIKVIAVPVGFESPGGGVTTIHEGTGCAIFWGAFFPAENKFVVSFLVKSQVVINFGVPF